MIRTDGSRLVPRIRDWRSQGVSPEKGPCTNRYTGRKSSQKNSDLTTAKSSSKLAHFSPLVRYQSYDSGIRASIIGTPPGSNAGGEQLELHYTDN